MPPRTTHAVGPEPRARKTRDRNAAASNPTLVIARAEALDLSKVQQEFNRLVTRIEKLHAQIERETERLERSLKFYAVYLQPIERGVVEKGKRLSRALARTAERRRMAVSQRALLRQAILRCLSDVANVEGGLHDADLRGIFERFVAMKSGGAKTAEDDLIDAFKELFGGLHCENIPPAGGSSAADGPTPPDDGPVRPRVSKAEARRAARDAELSQARDKGLQSIYRRLAKLLHPDLETDPERKAEKESLMRQLNTAHESRDLHTVLRLELEWIHREERDLGRLTDDKLRLYNEVLKEQAADLKQKLLYLPRHGRFGPLERHSPRLWGVRRFDGPAALEALEARDAKLAALSEAADNPAAHRQLLRMLSDFCAGEAWDEWDSLPAY